MLCKPPKILPASLLGNGEMQYIGQKHSLYNAKLFGMTTFFNITRTHLSKLSCSLKYSSGITFLASRRTFKYSLDVGCPFFHSLSR